MISKRTDSAAAATFGVDMVIVVAVVVMKDGNDGGVVVVVSDVEVRGCLWVWRAGGGGLLAF